MLVPWESLNVSHINTSLFSEGAERKLCRMAMEESWSGTETDFRAYIFPLTNVALLKYLLRSLMATDEYSPELVSNLHNYGKKWAQMYRILGREGLNAQTSGNFFKAGVQAVLLFSL